MFYSTMKGICTSSSHETKGFVRISHTGWGDFSSNMFLFNLNLKYILMLVERWEPPQKGWLITGNFDAMLTIRKRLVRNALPNTYCCNDIKLGHWFSKRKQFITLSFLVERSRCSFREGCTKTTSWAICKANMVYCTVDSQKQHEHMTVKTKARWDSFGELGGACRCVWLQWGPQRLRGGSQTEFEWQMRWDQSRSSSVEANLVCVCLSVNFYKDGTKHGDITYLRKYQCQTLKLCASHRFQTAPSFFGVSRSSAGDLLSAV